jgi:hypothetical protein
MLKQDEPINAVARTHEEKVEDWRYRKASRILYKWFDWISPRFFESALPAPVQSFAPSHHTYGHYVVGRNEIGVKENININPRHLNRPLYETLSTLVHELTHAWTKNSGKPSGRRGHGKAWREKMAQIGIICDHRGHHLELQDPWVAFLHEHGVKVEDQPEELIEETRRDSSSGTCLKRWACGCPTRIWACVRVTAICTRCGKRFVRLSGTSSRCRAAGAHTRGLAGRHAEGDLMTCKEAV